MSEAWRDDFVRRTLREWALFEGLYALGVAATVLLLVPWKTPWINLSLLAYAALHLAAAPGLWRQRRWGWRLAVVGSLLGWLAMVLVVSGLMASWAYLRGVYGDFGFGASIASLLFSGLAVLALGLFPGALLRNLLRREVRAALGLGRGLRSLLWGSVGLPPLCAVVVAGWVQISPLAPVPQAGREQAVAHLRAALQGEHRPPMPALAGVDAQLGVYVTAWREGRPSARVFAKGPSLDQAIRSAADQLVAKRPGVAVRLKLDRVVGLGRIWERALPLSVSPGIDGLIRAHSPALDALLPDDLISGRRFGAAPLIEGIDEVRIGLDRSVGSELGPASNGPIRRLRTEAWVEFEGQALAVGRNNTPGPPPGPDSWRQAAYAGADYMARHQRKSGKFDYIYLSTRDSNARQKYNIVRHAGAAWSLLTVYASSQNPRHLRAARRGLDWLVKRLRRPCVQPGLTCVSDKRSARLGESTLAAVAFLEYHRQTGDDRYDPIAREMLAYLLWMRRGDGEFNHRVNRETGEIDTSYRPMFASEEAALALVIGHEVLGDPEYLAAAEAALDWQTGPKYDFFLGRFVYGADAWTCIAADEAWPRLQKRRYLDFCRGYVSFLRGIQYQPGEWNHDDFIGHYGFGALLVPQAPAAAGFSEAVVSTWRLASHFGIEDPALARQAALSLDALSRDQLRPENSWLARNPRRALGGIRRSLVEGDVRIDFAQHAVGALIRGAEVLKDARLDSPPRRL